MTGKLYFLKKTSKKHKIIFFTNPICVKYMAWICECIAKHLNRT